MSKCSHIHVRSLYNTWPGGRSCKELLLKEAHTKAPRRLGERGDRYGDALGASLLMAAPGSVALPVITPSLPLSCAPCVAASGLVLGR